MYLICLLTSLLLYNGQIAEVLDTPEDFNNIVSYLRPGLCAEITQQKRLIPTYDKELQETLLHKFHVGASHFEYYKIYTMLYEKHIGIPQNKVKTFAQKVSYLYPKCNNQRKKNNITPIIASAPCNASR